jgi:hypothetical protein
MSDFDLDALLAGAVSDYRDETSSLINPEGTGAAIAMAKHRRKVHAMAMSALAAVLIVAPVAAYAAVDHNRHGPPVLPAGSASPSPSAVASVEPSTPPPSPASTPSSTDSSGANSVTAFKNATLDLPGWASPSCPHGRTRFHDGKAGDFTTINAVNVGDVTGDGSPDVVAMIGCRPGEGAENQVIVFHVSGDGTISTTGVVVQPAPNAKAFDDQIQNVADMHISGATITVHVGDYETTYTDNNARGIYQDRIYGWNGHEFAQTGGPTSFSAASSVHLSISKAQVQFGTAKNGTRKGTVTVTSTTEATRRSSMSGCLSFCRITPPPWGPAAR